MKLSIYNSSIPLNSKLLLLYNAYTDSFIIKKNDTKVLNIDSLKIHEKDLFDRLVQNGFILDEHLDEVELVKKRREKYDNNPSVTSIIINPTLDCNFRCWYCYEEHLQGSAMQPKTEQKVLKFIERTVTDPKLKKLHLGFFGGEPLLRFLSMERIITHAQASCRENDVSLRIMITSNGYNFFRENTEKLADLGCPVEIQITLDGDRETHNKVRFTTTKKGSYDRIISNIKLLLEKNLRVSLRINFTEETLTTVESIIGDLSCIPMEFRKYLWVNFHRVWQDRDKQGASNIDSQLKEIQNAYRNNQFKVSQTNNDRVRHSCYADKKQGAVINYDGSVFRCTANDFVNTPREGFIDESGKLIWENNSDTIRYQSKLANRFCQTCRIFPICGGHCTQRTIQNIDSTECLMGFDEEKKDRMILDKLNDYHLNRKGFGFK